NAESRASSASMKIFSAACRRVILSTSARVSSTVSGDGGQSNQDRPSRCRWAVGSPSVTIKTTGSCSGCRSIWRPASSSAWCRLVPRTMSQPRTAAPQQRVPHRCGDVEGLLVAEFPGAGGAGQLTGLAGVPQVVVAGPAEAQVGEDPAQRRVPEPAHGLGGELELTGVARQVTL